MSDIAVTRVHFTYRITPEALNGLIVQAVDAGYIKSTSMGKYKGLGNFVEEQLSNWHYYDARPQYMKNMDGLPIYSGRKFWVPEGEIRRYNAIKISEMCMEKLLGIAEVHGICNLKRKNGPIEYVNVIGLVLEAIGKGWLRSV